MMPDYNKAATKAAECLIKYNIHTFPVSPLPILEQMDDVIVVSFAEMSSASGYRKRDIMPLFGKNRDAITSVCSDNGRQSYVVVYDGMLPFPLRQRALARELGHIVLRHTGCSEENTAEALCFAAHFLCPRPLVHAIQATCLHLSVDLLANLTGIFEQFLFSIRRLPGTVVSSGLNRFVRNQCMPFVLNIFEYYQTALPADGSAAVDFGSFMDGYEE